MSRTGAHVRAAVNPLSTAATRWWCHSALRYLLTGYGPRARQRRRVRRQMLHAATGPPSVAQMKARAAATGQALARHDHE